MRFYSQFYFAVPFLAVIFIQILSSTFALAFCSCEYGFLSIVFCLPMLL